MIAKLLIIHFILHNSADEKLYSEKLEDVDDVDDFKVNVQMFSRSPTPTNDNSSDSSINPMKGLQMAEFAFSDDDQSDDVLANNRLEDKLKSLTVSGKDVRSVVNDLSEAVEVLTEDEVEEEIEEDVIEDETAENTKNRNRSNSRNKDISERNNLSSPRSVSDAEIRTVSKQEKNRTRSQQSYTADFSSESEVRTQNSPPHSYTGSEQNTSRSSRTSKSSRSSRSSRDSRSSRRSRSSRTSRSSRSSRSHERSRSKESSTDFSKNKVPLLFMRQDSIRGGFYHAFVHFPLFMGFCFTHHFKIIIVHTNHQNFHGNLSLLNKLLKISHTSRTFIKQAFRL